MSVYLSIFLSDRLSASTPVRLIYSYFLFLSLERYVALLRLLRHSDLAHRK